MELSDGTGGHHLVQQIAIPDLFDHDNCHDDREQERHDDHRGGETGIPRRTEGGGSVADVHDPFPVGGFDGDHLGGIF